MSSLCYYCNLSVKQKKSCKFLHDLQVIFAQLKISSPFTLQFLRVCTASSVTFSQNNHNKPHRKDPGGSRQLTKLGTSWTLFVKKHCWGEELECVDVQRLLFFWRAQFLYLFTLTPFNYPTLFLFSYHPILILSFPWHWDATFYAHFLSSHPTCFLSLSLALSSLSPSSLVPTALALAGLSCLVQVHSRSAWAARPCGSWPSLRFILWQLLG